MFFISIDNNTHSDCPITTEHKARQVAGGVSWVYRSASVKVLQSTDDGLVCVAKFQGAKEIK
jgi:hypothetical protein